MAVGLAVGDDPGDVFRLEAQIATGKSFLKVTLVNLINLERQTETEETDRGRQRGGRDGGERERERNRERYKKERKREKQRVKYRLN